MEKILITGFSGFVSRHFLDYLYEKNYTYDVLGVDIHPPKMSLEPYKEVLNIQFKELNLLDKDLFDQVIKEYRPDYILHLASFSSVAYSWKHPAECFSNNTQIFLNIIECLRKNSLTNCRVLSVGSSEEYGNVTEEQLPLKENMHLEPISPYAVARVSQEQMAKVFVNGYGMNIILTRSFNHMGPYQDTRFVIPSFVKRILEIASTGEKNGTIETGDTTIIRDFVDVRDVVQAYYLLLTKGTPGEIYNICSGRGVSLKEIVDEIADLIGVSVTEKVNPEFIRPGDNKKIIGSFQKIENELGWKPVIPLRKTLQDMIDDVKNSERNK